MPSLSHSDGSGHVRIDCTQNRHQHRRLSGLAGEADGEQRHDYIDGQVHAMTGASDRHGLIVHAMVFAMMPAARRKGRQLFTSGMKVRVDIADKSSFYYPDLLLSCDP